MAPLQSQGPLLLLLPLWALRVSLLAAHPCEQEVSSACSDTPGSELARCLKDKTEHEKATEISSDCTDFIAVNVACAEEITQFCDESFFSDDTVLCLTQWTDKGRLSSKCSSVIQWAVPGSDDESADGPTDELGLSAKDYAEKREWQEKRKSERGAAIERLKSQKAEEKEDAELELLKKENPEEYKQRLKEREEAKKSFEELKRRQRLMAAAKERKRREEAGLPSVEEEEAAKRKKTRSSRSTKDEANWLPIAFVVIFVVVFGSAALNKMFGEKDEKKST
eukprot:TRINITY_DN49939_c0_g1_i1.p1 TRINITY_DN49939_c0_g1~~TRINITY_DN49939_c0_g1_i1.p1  ORF type:complete len:288 (+),score=98.98 TRINITY_DN49939_c0_g1_i1:25-864(+)